MRRCILTTVVKVWEQHDKVHVTGTGSEAVFRKVSRGWFVQFAGSYESLFFGQEKPNLEEGDKVKISFEKIKENTK